MAARYFVNVSFFQPPEHLRRYFTTFYLFELDAPDNVRIQDFLQPEWANLRFYSGDFPDAESVDGTRLSGSAFAATGPSAKALPFVVGKSRMWGIGLLPIGWARFVNYPAGSVANSVYDGFQHPAFAPFVPLARSIFGEEPDPEAELARIISFFDNWPQEPIDDEERIGIIHSALVDCEVKTVVDLVARANCSQRTIERLCQRSFGFSPKVLLRRQRFMRSLTQFMLDPSLRWIGAIDSQYHDQAQFVRDFREFMGMTPSQYATHEKPVLTAVMRERARIAGSAAQTLDAPRITIPVEAPLPRAAAS